MSYQNVAILAHGKNWEVPVPPNPADIRLSIESNLTADAAGWLLAKHETQAEHIILSTGFTAGPEYPSEAAAMRDRLRERFSTTDIPDEALLMEESSFDTTGNLHAVQALCEEHGIDGLVLLSIGYHLPRIRHLARHILTVPVVGAYKSDEVVARHMGVNTRHMYADLVMQQAIERRSLKPLVRTASSYLLEAAGWGMALVDPTGTGISAKATARIRNQ